MRSQTVDRTTSFLLLHKSPVRRFPLSSYFLFPSTWITAARLKYSFASAINRGNDEPASVNQVIQEEKLSFQYLTPRLFPSSWCSYWAWSGGGRRNLHCDQLGQTTGSYHRLVTSISWVATKSLSPPCGQSESMSFMVSSWTQVIESSTRRPWKARAPSWISPTRPRPWPWATSGPGGCTTSASTPWRTAWRACRSLCRSPPLEIRCQVNHVCSDRHLVCVSFIVCLWLWLKVRNREGVEQSLSNSLFYIFLCFYSYLHNLTKTTVLVKRD